jgi:hypothetical protein
MSPQSERLVRRYELVRKDTMLPKSFAIPKSAEVSHELAGLQIAGVATG